MLGHKLVQSFGNEFDVFASVRSERNTLVEIGLIKEDRLLTGLDVINYKDVDRVIKEVRPDVIVNAVGVIKHRKSAETVLSIQINSLLPHQLAKTAGEIGAKLITFSTDCVFDGQKGDYVETDPTNALDVYGKSKAMGELLEEHCLTVRTSIIGRELNNSASLVEWFIANKNGKVKGFRKAIYTGLTTIAAARALIQIIKEYPKLSGIYHVSSDKINKWELLNLINMSFSLGIDIEPDDEFVIDRSLRSDKFRDETGFEPLSWPLMIEEMATDAAMYDTWRTLQF